MDKQFCCLYYWPGLHYNCSASPTSSSLQKKVKWTGFFQVFGQKPLVYLFAFGITGDRSLYDTCSARIKFISLVYANIFSYAGAYLGSLLFAIAYMMVCWSVGYWLDKRKIYIKV